MNLSNNHPPLSLIDFRITYDRYCAVLNRYFCTAVAVFLILFTQILPVNAQAIRALVIGIDDYKELHDLEGAINDARDIAAALSDAGVLDLVVLEDEQANRQRIEDEWNAILARSNIGDTVVLTYAGHGGQEPERILGQKPMAWTKSYCLEVFKAGARVREKGYLMMNSIIGLNWRV